MCQQGYEMTENLVIVLDLQMEIAGDLLIGTGNFYAFKINIAGFTIPNDLVDPVVNAGKVIKYMVFSFYDHMDRKLVYFKLCTRMRNGPQFCKFSIG
jgi:hypothetical protein